MDHGKYIAAITMMSWWESSRQFEGIEKAPKKKGPLQRGSSLLHGYGFGRMRMFTLEGDKDFFVYVAMPCAHDDFAHGNRCFAAVLQVGVETQGDFL
jgi:hypothetical protein